nr:integrase, catalytic region, zinc finger, CCHC-type, peptidase aspartic, catalytic [Tanacetum cinerariifolium]
MEHFEGIQKDLTKEIKEMKDVFEELEAKVAQNVVDRKHDEIERKNLLIANDNLIVDCLSKEVFYVAMNSELNISRFTKMHVANTIVEARCLELKAELYNLRDKSHNDNHNELVNWFSNLEVTALTTKNVNLKAQILNNVNSVSKDHVKPIVLAPGKYVIDVEPIPSRLMNNREAHLDYLRHFKESVETIYEIVEEAKVVRPLDSSTVSACRYTKHSQELIEYAIGTCLQDSHQQDKKHAPAPFIRKKQVTFAEQCDISQPRGNTKKNRISLGTEGTPHLGSKRPRVYSDLSSKEKDRYNPDIRATNILLQGLPKDIYTFINHYTDAKDIWDNVKMLLEGSELTREDHELQLYYNFEHLR